MLSASDVRICFLIGPQDGVGDKLKLTVENTSKQAGVLHLPELLNGADTKLNERREHFVILRVSKPGSEKEQEFGWTCVTKKEPKISQNIALQPGENYQQLFPLASLYRWGPCGPDGYSFKDYFTNGTNEVQLKVLFLKGKDQSPMESEARTYKYSFPEWMFQKRAGMTPKGQ